MKLTFKLAFGSIAVATLTGFVLYPDASGSQPGAATADASRPTHPPFEAESLLAPLPHCPGRCEAWALMWGTR